MMATGILKLSKQQMKERDVLVRRIVETKGKLEDAVAEFNEKLSSLKAPVEESTVKLNELIAEANELVSAIHSDMEMYYDDRSEQWQEGEKGQDYLSWMEEFATEFDEVDVEFPGNLEMPDVDCAETLEALPDAPG